MRDGDKTRDQLISELHELRRRLDESEKAEVKSKQTERELLEARKMFQLVLDTIPVRVFWKDLDSNFLGCNRPFAVDAGLESPEEIIGLNDFEMGWAEQAELYRRDDRRVIESGQSKLGYEEPQTTPNGSRMWLRTNKVPLLDTDGTIKGILGTYEDITEWKHIEETLRDSEARYRIVADNTYDWEYWTSPERRFLYTSPSSERITGYKASDFEADPNLLFHIIHPNDLSRYEAHLEDAESKRFSGSLEFRIIHRDGTTRWIGHVCQPVFDTEGRFLGRRGSNRDITDQKQAEQALRESEQRFRLALRNTPVSVAVQDRDLRYIWAYNQRMTIPQKIVGLFDHEIFTAEEASHITKIKQRVLDEDTEFREQVWFNRPSGRVFLDICWEPVHDQFGHVVGVASARVDLTPMKLAEESLKTALAEKEVLLKEIHHRVKNNMQVISSLVALQAKHSPDVSIRAVLREITHRVRSMSIVHEKLYQSADLARVDLSQYVRTLLKYLWRAYETESARIQLILDLEPVALAVDAAVPFGLILNELVTNALKHAFRDGGQGEVSVSLRSNIHGRVRLSVRDNGEGMPEGYDWREAQSLGLRLVQMLARQLRASIEVSRCAGTGFTVTFEA